jgi:hypothetical protein
MKQSIVLEGRAYHSIKKVQQDFGLDHKTLTKWTRNGQLPVPVRRTHHQTRHPHGSRAARLARRRRPGAIETAFYPNLSAWIKASGCPMVAEANELFPLPIATRSEIVHQTESSRIELANAGQLTVIRGLVLPMTSIPATFGPGTGWTTTPPVRYRLPLPRRTPTCIMRR